MAALYNLPVVLGFLALYYVGIAAEKCTTVLYGQQNFNEHLLTLAYFSLATKVQDIRVHAGCDAVGVKVIACDDVAPNVYVKSPTQVLINRLGSLYYFGYADIVAYCPQYAITPLLADSLDSHEDQSDKA